MEMREDGTPRQDQVYRSVTSFFPSQVTAVNITTEG